MFYYLRLDRGGKTLHFAVERSKVVGRSEAADIHLRDIRVSRLHCRLVPGKGGLWIEDVSKVNETRINGLPLAGRQALVRGDIIQIGPYFLQVEVRQSWLDQERLWERAALELRRLKRRAMARFPTVLIVTLLLAGLTAYRKSGKPKFFEASIVFLIEEIHGEDGRRVPPPPKPQLRQYIFDGVFTRENSLAVIQKFKLFPAKMVLDVNWAIQQFRDNVAVGVFQNEFLLPGDDLDERTARISIGYTGRSVDEAINVTRELGQLLQAHEEATRRESARVAEAFVEHRIKRWARKLDSHGVEAARLQAIAGNEKATEVARAQATVRLRSLQGDMEIARWRLDEANRDYTRASLLRVLEDKSSQLRFRMVDTYQTPAPPVSPAVRGAITGTVVFVFGLPLIGILIGMLDQRLYGVQDIERLGILSLGQVCALPGQDVGNLATRLGARRRLRWRPWRRR